ncbi:hypothetical protein QTN47_20265 [Danxiaibacter flavus]|uniref:Uncharacterized protein n=1 Tax=Danxiaibacter flavus TaxID=3049108 RepID=A0ABV3ZMQ9_9BACT|nr:hypothetical protein QNM32_20270 [Chitinophagaceae bacterium DXS]
MPYFKPSNNYARSVFFGCGVAFADRYTTELSKQKDCDPFIYLKANNMPWYNGNYPPSYKNQPVKIRNKATEIANELLLNGSGEGVAIATGLKRAREFYKEQEAASSKKKSAHNKRPS